LFKSSSPGSIPPWATKLAKVRTDLIVYTLNEMNRGLILVVDKYAFLKSLDLEGLPEPVLVEREHGEMGVHHHPFESKALIIDGSISIVIDGVKTEYRTGDEFHLMPYQKHSESYGLTGVKYLVSRKESM